MLAKISARLELIFLDIFIYVLSDTKWFRMMVRGFYALTNDRRFLRQFKNICIMFCLFGMCLGWIISVFLKNSAIWGF